MTTVRVMEQSAKTRVRDDEEAVDKIEWCIADCRMVRESMNTSIDRHHTCYERPHSKVS